MDCEMCGREQAIIRASVEGSILAVCQGCGKYGKAVGRISTPIQAKAAKAEEKPLPEEETEFIVANSGQLLKHKREQLGLKQEEFARKIAVKESALHKMETGALPPSIPDARRIEKLLGMKLIERVQVAEKAVPEAKKDQLTLGDMIKIRKTH